MSAAAALAGEPLTISRSPDCNAAEWNAFVTTHKDGSFFHLAGWGKAVQRAYGYESTYIIARCSGAIVGVLSLCDARTPLLGRSLISTAFSVGGGPLADSEDVRAALLHEAEKVGREKQVGYIECRSDFTEDGWLTKTGMYANFETPLIPDEKAALAAIPRKRRAELRKAIESAAVGDLSVRHDGTANIFYDLYASALHRLGTPIFPKSFLQTLLEEFPDQTEITVVEAGDEPVAALVSFYFKEKVLPYYVGANRKARETRAFDYLYWMVMLRAAGKGVKTFDFGRSKIDSGAFHYKKLWGIEPKPLSYQIKLITAESMPQINAANPKFSAFAKLWPRLPGAVANRLGPILAPNFP